MLQATLATRERFTRCAHRCVSQAVSRAWCFLARPSWRVNCSAVAAAEGDLARVLLRATIRGWKRFILSKASIPGYSGISRDVKKGGTITHIFLRKSLRNRRENTKRYGTRLSFEHKENNRKRVFSTVWKYSDKHTASISALKQALDSTNWLPFARLCVIMTLCICWKFSAVEVLAPLSNSGCAAHVRVITSSRFRFPFIPARVSLSSFT